MYQNIRNLIKTEVEDIVTECNLDDDDKAMIIMLCKGGSIQEISQKMLISTATVTRRIRRIQKRIQMIKN